jgi:hypothetical protein
VNSLVKVHESVGFLDKVTILHFSRCSNLIHLPSSILQLQHLDYLCVRWCPKLATNVRDERHSMLPIVSIEERRELLLSPPPANSSISDVGCSSVGFPALTTLVLDKIYFSETLFPSTLEILDISRSEIVSLPAWIKRFVRLKWLQVDRMQATSRNSRTSSKYKRNKCRWMCFIGKFSTNIKRKSIQYKSVASVTVD